MSTEPDKETAQSIASRINDGTHLALAPDYSGCAMAVIAQLITKRARGLHLIGVPQMGLQADLLIGAGCVTSIDAASVTLSEFGQAPRFVNACQQREIVVKDSTCPVIHAGLQASEKGIPYMPLRGIIETDLVKHRSDWKITQNPYADENTDDPILLVPAIKPDVALFHAPIADSEGNVWIGKRRELMLMAHASQSTYVTVESIVDESLLEDPAMAAGVIPSLYITALAEVPRGAEPIGLFNRYPVNAPVLKHYATAARSEHGFREFLDQWLHPAAQAASAQSPEHTAHD